MQYTVLFQLFGVGFGYGFDFPLAEISVLTSKVDFTLFFKLQYCRVKEFRGKWFPKQCSVSTNNKLKLKQFVVFYDSEDTHTPALPFVIWINHARYRMQKF